MRICDMCGKQIKNKNNNDIFKVNIETKNNNDYYAFCEYECCNKCSKKIKKFIDFERARNNRRSDNE